MKEYGATLTKGLGFGVSSTGGVFGERVGVPGKVLLGAAAATAAAGAAATCAPDGGGGGGREGLV